MSISLRPRLSRRRLLLAGALFCPVILGTSSCGYILYPERKGRKGGDIDTPILIVDLLWLLPGIIPGAICLIVDFTTGCIYEGHHRTSRATRGEISRKLATASVVIDDIVFAHAQVASDLKAALTWKRAVDEEALRGRARLVLQRSDGARAEAFVHELI